MDQKVPGSNLTDTYTSFDTLCCQGHNPVSGMEFGISYIKNHTTLQRDNEKLIRKLMDPGLNYINGNRRQLWQKED